MHATTISENAMALQRRRRGDAAPIALKPGAFAHIIVDMQYGFMPGGEIPIATNHAIIPNVNRVAAATRRAGGTNIFVRFTYDPEWTAYYGRFEPDQEQAMKSAFADGAAQHALHADLDLNPVDIIMNKTRFSCLTPGSSGLDDWLEAAGVATLIVTGCTSNCCCESTIRDALQLNYNAIFVADAAATLSDADHNGAVNDLFGIFGCDVCTADEVIDRLASAAAA